MTQQRTFYLETFACLQEAAIPAAVILTASPKTAPSLEGRVDLKAGTLEVASYASGKAQSEC